MSKPEGTWGTLWYDGTGTSAYDNQRYLNATYATLISTPTASNMSWSPDPWGEQDRRAEEAADRAGAKLRNKLNRLCSLRSQLYQRSYTPRAVERWSPAPRRPCYRNR